MNTNLRALIFGTAVAAALTTTLDVVYAAPAPQVIRLDGITVTAHRDVASADVVRLDEVVVTARKAA